MNSAPRKRNQQLLRHRIWDRPGTLKPKRSAVEQLSRRLLQRARRGNDSMSEQSEPGVERSVEKRPSLRNESGVQPEQHKTSIPNHSYLFLSFSFIFFQWVSSAIQVSAMAAEAEGSGLFQAVSYLLSTLGWPAEPPAPSCKVTADPKLQELIIKGEELVQRGQDSCVRWSVALYAPQIFVRTIHHKSHLLKTSEDYTMYGLSLITGFRSRLRLDGLRRLKSWLVAQPKLEKSLTPNGAK